jgi:hypothetical protein
MPLISESATRSTKDSENGWDIDFFVNAMDMMTQLGLVNVDVLQMMHHGSIEGSIVVRNQSCEILDMIQQAELKQDLVISKYGAERRSRSVEDGSTELHSGELALPIETTLFTPTSINQNMSEFFDDKEMN